MRPGRLDWNTENRAKDGIAMRETVYQPPWDHVPHLAPAIRAPSRDSRRNEDDILDEAAILVDVRLCQPFEATEDHSSTEANSNQGDRPCSSDLGTHQALGEKL